MKLQTVSNRKLYLQIADQIREQIVTGTASPGQQLPSERDLALALGVSRPTVREALIALEVAGLVEVRIGVGAFVRTDVGKAESLPEVAHSPTEVMAMRQLLEPEAAALAAKHIAEPEQKELGRIVAAMRRETTQGKWSADSDRAFHMTIAEGGGNQALRELLSQLWSWRSEDVDHRFHLHLANEQSLRQRIMSDHGAICGAILDGDAEQARAAMKAHLDYVEMAMLRVWD